MKQEWEDIITKHIGIKPIRINSSLVSAQNRDRNYWTNIPVSHYPEDKHIYLKDILENGIVDRGITDKSVQYIINKKGRPNTDMFRKARCLTVSGKSGGTHSDMDLIPYIPTMFTECRTEEAKQIRREYKQKFNKDYSPRRGKELVAREDGKSNCLTTSLTNEHILLDEQYNFRKLTPIECERLQTVMDNYTNVNGVSKSQRYKMLGNGWTVDVIAFILSFIKQANDGMNPIHIHEQYKEFAIEW